MKKSILKDITLVIIGMGIVGVPVMAVSYIPSRDVSYKTDYNENVTNVEEALDILTNQVNELNNTGDSLSSDILSGKTAYVNGKLLTGSMSNYSGINTTASNITESGSNALITVPGGYYDDNSTVSVPLNTIENLPTIKNNLVVVNSEIVTKTLEAHGGAAEKASYKCPDGYEPLLHVAMANVWNASASIWFFTDSTVYITFTNNYPVESTVSAYAKILCIKV